MSVSRTPGNRRPYLKTLAALALAAAVARPVSAAPVSLWDGGGANANWSIALNWANDTVPVDSTTAAGDVDLQFGGNVNLSPNLDTTISIGSGGFNTFALTFNAGASGFTLTDSKGSGLDMLGSRTNGQNAKVTNLSATAQTIAMKLIVRGDQGASATEFVTSAGDINVTNVISSAAGVAATAGIVKSGTSILNLSAANTYAGPTLISGGTIKTLTAGRLGATNNASTVTVKNTAVTLDISPATITGSATDAIPDTASLVLEGGGVAGTADVGYLTLGTANETVFGLTLGGVLQVAGTYGSTASNATFKNNEYFSGTGTVIVTAPEPATAALLTLAACGLAVQRRRKPRASK